MKFRVQSLVFIAALYITGCGDIDRQLSPFEIYPSDLKAEASFGTRVEGNDEFVMVGARGSRSEMIQVFKRSGEEWALVATLEMNWIDFDVSDEHAAVSYFEGNGAKTAVYSLAGGEFILQKQLEVGAYVGMGPKSLIIGPVGNWEAYIYKENAGLWELSGAFAISKSSSPVLDVGENYACAATTLNSDTIAEVYKFEAGTWNANRTITVTGVNFILFIDITDDYVAIPGGDGIKVFQLADAGAPPISITKEFDHISACAIHGNKILVADNEVQFVPSQTWTAKVGLYTIDAGVANPVKTFVSDNGNPIDHYGASVELAPGYLFVGCPNDSDAGRKTGSVYYYKH
jgi:hypothetical protein